ncbi:SIN3-like 2 [Pyrus ussuriensis x Pyrus communis]|uniref:SIN3-like 2 n=1 Tax=Pyrus ussuriensis x Pyrus communis TaxID=2448454 RepID=A0A5N5FGR3_9ROSA|nr:SIN3-like 2 [Pyrus ussuriensis x Pyrus communis]
MENNRRENALVYVLKQLQGVEHFKDAQEKKVREKLRSNDKFVEFLKQLQLYSSGVIDLTEFLNLVDDVLQADEDLMNEFDGFLEHCEKEQMNWSLRSES